MSCHFFTTLFDDPAASSHKYVRTSLNINYFHVLKLLVHVEPIQQNTANVIDQIYFDTDCDKVLSEKSLQLVNISLLF